MIPLGFTHETGVSGGGKGPGGAMSWSPDGDTEDGELITAVDRGSTCR